MERQKIIVGKKGKGPPGELFALGKSNPQERPDIKHSCSLQPVGNRNVGSNVRRDVLVPCGTSLISKKPKLLGHSFTPGHRAMTDTHTVCSLSQPEMLAFEEAAIVVEPSELLTKVLAACKEGDKEKIEGLICGAIKHVRNNRFKPDQTVVLTLFYLTKTQPTFFVSDLISEAFCSILKLDAMVNFKAKGNCLVFVLACHAMMAAYSAEDNWPDSFVKVYIDDLLGERVWVDREDCSCFVGNILTAFPTKLSPKELLVSTDSASLTFSIGGSSPSHFRTLEEAVTRSPDSSDSNKVLSSLPCIDLPVLPRYSNQQTSIQNYLLDIVRENLNRRKSLDTGCRNLIRLMTVTAGYAEIRTMAIQRLEMWLQNPKLGRLAQDLLLAVCCNNRQEEPTDRDVVLHLIKMRLKTKCLQSHLFSSIRELLNQDAENVRLVLRTTILNELNCQSNRNLNNMSLFSITFTHSPLVSSKVQAEVIQDLLVNDIDYLRAVRGVLKEIFRLIAKDIDFVVFCRSLTRSRLEAMFTDADPAIKERYVMSIADVIAYSMLHCVFPLARDAALQKDQGYAQKIQEQLSVIMRDAVYWLHTIVPQFTLMKAPEYVYSLRKVLFLESSEHYAMCGWAHDNEKILLLQFAQQAPLLEDSLMRLTLMGLTKEIPLSANDCMDIVFHLVYRSAALHSETVSPVLCLENMDIFSALFNLSTYHHPDNTILPTGYQPPMLAVVATYWRAWSILLILAAFNPTTIGRQSWEHYPMLQCLMELVMTNKYKYPPETLVSSSMQVDDICSAENQERELESQRIIEFESFLANKMITRDNSLLLSQLASLDPHGIARRPSNEFLSSLEKLNSSLRIGRMLCSSREPDFLVEIVRRQGDFHPMPWLADLVVANDGSLDVLPVECVCEFLVQDLQPSSAPTGHDLSKTEQHRLSQKRTKHREVFTQLQRLLHAPADSWNKVVGVISFFLHRLMSSQSATRRQAVKGLLLLTSDVKSDHAQRSNVDATLDKTSPGHKWLLEDIPSLSVFDYVKAEMCSSLHQACLVEIDPTLVHAYILFFSQHSLNFDLQALDELTSDVSQLVVERSSMMACLLPDFVSQQSGESEVCLAAFLDIFCNYTSKARIKGKQYSWSNRQDQVIVQWGATQESAILQIVVVHALVILLCHVPPSVPRAYDIYKELLDIWFPKDDGMPKAYLMDTSEEALLLPDWLKLKMIRSSQARLVDAALHELEPEKMLIFIQSFGIPVSSMNLLLDRLDQKVAQDADRYLKSILVMMNGAYLTQLLQVQWDRGVTAGHVLYGLLTGPEDTSLDDDSSDVMECSHSTEVLEITQPTPVDEGDIEMVASHFFNLFRKESSAQESEKLFQLLLKVFACEPEKASGVMLVVVQCLTSSGDVDFALNLLDRSDKTCPLFKIFLSKQDSASSELTAALETILSVAGNRKTSLVAIVRQFLHAQVHCQDYALRRSHASMRHDAPSIENNVRSHNFINAVCAASTADGLASLVNRYMQQSVLRQAAADGVHSACSLLTQHTDRLPAVTSLEPLLTDWLELLDPEILNCCPDLQEELVFGRNPHVHGQLVGPSAPPTPQQRPLLRDRNAYAMSLLLHQTQWSTLQRCLRRILRPDKLLQLDPTSVLDFVSACRRIPKIWQGRELRNGHQIDAVEDIFNFTEEQLLSVLDFIVLEKLQLKAGNDKLIPHCASDGCHVDNTDGSPMDVKTDCSNRLNLLLACICKQDDRVKSIVSHVLRKSEALSRYEYSGYIEVIQNLYPHFPFILSLMKSSAPVNSQLIIADDIYSKLDMAVQRLIGAVGKDGPNKAVDVRMMDASIACRKLAARHPVLVLRQLPLFAAVLGGRSQLSLAEMMHRNLLQLFTHVLGILELLQPHVFHHRHTALPTILLAFFHLFRVRGSDVCCSQCVDVDTMLSGVVPITVHTWFTLVSVQQVIQAHGKEKKSLGGLLSKFVTFLNNFMHYDSRRAGSVLEQYLPLFSDLAREYADMSDLRTLLTGLQLPRQHLTDCGGVSLADGPVCDVTHSRFLTDGLSFSQIQPFRKRLNPSNSADALLQVLSELDETSKRRVGILQHFEEELAQLMTHIHGQCRRVTFTLIKRLVNHSPLKASGFFPNYVRCLQHDEPDVMLTALKNMAEFAVFFQDEVSVLLQRAFEVGVTSTIDTSPYITDTLHLLNMESVLEL